jgi:hypothetical protein
VLGTREEKEYLHLEELHSISSKPYISNEKLAFLLHTQEVPSLILNPKTGHPDKNSPFKSWFSGL